MEKEVNAKESREYIVNICGEKSLGWLKRPIHVFRSYRVKSESSNEAIVDARITFEREEEGYKIFTISAHAQED